MATKDDKPEDRRDKKKTETKSANNGSRLRKRTAHGLGRMICVKRTKRNKVGGWCATPEFWAIEIFLELKNIHVVLIYRKVCLRTCGGLYRFFLGFDRLPKLGHPS